VRENGPRGTLAGQPMTVARACAPVAWECCCLTGSRGGGPRGEDGDALRTGRPRSSLDIYRDSALNTGRPERGRLQSLKRCGGDYRCQCRRTFHLIGRGVFHSEFDVFDQSSIPGSFHFQTSDMMF
jgi:hypothetical protein